MAIRDLAALTDSKKVNLHDVSYLRMSWSITEIKRTCGADETHKEFVIGENEIY